MKRLIHYLSCLCGALGCWAGFSAHGADAPAPAQEPTPQVWMCHLKELELADTAWESVQGRLDCLQFFIDRLVACPPDKLKAIVTQLKAKGIKTSVECGGLLDYAPAMDATLGEETAKIELAKLTHLSAAGADPDFLNLDGPLNRAMFPAAGKKALTLDQAVHETLDYMKAVRAVYPRIQFYLITNFPNWAWRQTPSYWNQPDNPQGYGEYEAAAKALVTAARAAGIPFYGMTVDNPYDYATGVHASPGLADPTKIDWMGRIRELEEWSRGQGLHFSIYFNCEASGMNSDEQYFKDTLAFINAYRARGGRPDVYLIESWYPHPVKAGPESEPWTMTYLVRAVLDKLKPAPAAAPAAP